MQFVARWLDLKYGILEFKFSDATWHVYFRQMELREVGRHMERTIWFDPESRHFWSNSVTGDYFTKVFSDKTIPTIIDMYNEYLNQIITEE